MRKVTISDIALEAGVSKSTVSRVLSNPDIVNEKTKQKILTIMEKHSYIPNQLAQGLAGTPTRTIGIVIDELSNFFFIEIAEGVDKVLSSVGYSMQLSSSRWVQERESQIVRSLISSRVDGVLLAPVSPESESITMLQHSGIPFVLINCIPEAEDISYVSCDNAHGGRLAAEYINTHQKEQTILITGFKHQSLNDRIDGFYAHISESIPVRHYPDIKTFEDGYELVPILLARNAIDSIRTTLFVTNDNVAIGIINHLVEYGIAIPQQVSVIGYDNIRLSSFSQIPLTTISQSIRDMGRIAALELLEMIKDTSHQPPKHLIKPQLVIRQSSEER